jgi:hypothetical protein
MGQSFPYQRSTPTNVRNRLLRATNAKNWATGYGRNSLHQKGEGASKRTEDNLKKNPTDLSSRIASQFLLFFIFFRLPALAVHPAFSFSSGGI